MNEKNFGTQGVDAQGLGSKFLSGKIFATGLPYVWFIPGRTLNRNILYFKPKKLKMTISSLLFVYW